eukprot:1157298-Pelagomonas_calceolata.AAC.18
MDLEASDYNFLHTCHSLAAEMWAWNAQASIPYLAAKAWLWRPWLRRCGHGSPRLLFPTWLPKPGSGDLNLEAPDYTASYAPAVAWPWRCGPGAPRLGGTRRVVGQLLRLQRVPADVVAQRRVFNPCVDVGGGLSCSQEGGGRCARQGTHPRASYGVSCQDLKRSHTTHAPGDSCVRLIVFAARISLILVSSGSGTGPPMVRCIRERLLHRRVHALLRSPSSKLSYNCLPILEQLSD